MDLSNLLAGLLPGDSFLLRRKASRFFMSLALGEGKSDERKRERVGEGGKGERKICDHRKTGGTSRWDKGRGNGKRVKGLIEEVDKKKKRHGKKVC